MREITYEEAKRKCRLTETEVEMAKALKISPKTLIHNIPSKSEPWKDPVALWIRRLHEKSFPNKA